MRVRYEPAATAQLTAIRDWLTDQADAETADRIVDGLVVRCDSLCDFPRRGTPRDDVRPGMRTVVHRRRYTIGYRIIDQTVVILGVLSAGQDHDVLTASS